MNPGACFVLEPLFSTLRALHLCLLCVASLLSLSLSPHAMGKSGDRNQPIHVVADSAELNEVTGVGVYRGDVRITQGSMVLTADRVTVFAPGRELQKLIAENDDQGDKAKFRQLTDAGDTLTARSRRMEYVPDENRITLLEDAVLRNGANRFAADRIVYDIARRIVDAGGGEVGGRVEMTLVPEDDAARDDEQPAKER
jgi:lipopolysaccharide export system protein LptA